MIALAAAVLALVAARATVRLLSPSGAVWAAAVVPAALAAGVFLLAVPRSASLVGGMWALVIAQVLYVASLLGALPDMRRRVAAVTASRAALALCGAAIAAGALLLVAGLTFPAYSGVECSAAPGTGEPSCRETTATLVGQNGLGVLIPLSLPLLGALGVTLLLSLRCRRGGRAYGTATAAVVALLFAFGVVSGFSIGLYVLPLAPLLAAAAALTPLPPARPGASAPA